MTTRLVTGTAEVLACTRSVSRRSSVAAAGSVPLRGGVTLIVAAPERDTHGAYGPPRVRYAIAKRITGDEGSARAARQRAHALALGLADGSTDDDRHFQVDFGLVHLGM